ncbi:hypothetical protein RHMOL_Rhmol03G0126000 [Rhododendron molle]|uniref:Uncharacterized protein n=1 Tax=Rhododendron molle TaxID=49168 RepID=A0ACC0PES5_RHOML|nr:hypothetical protein RHMOL_Rhmol03G0126000 [Rhododendron molle]
MAGDLVAEFPDLLQSNPPRIRVLGSPTSRVSPRVDIIEMLEKTSIPTTESTIDGPAAKQIRDLNQEVTQLKWLLAEKEKLLGSKQPAPASPGMVSVPQKDGSLVMESGPINMLSVPVVELVRGKAQSPVGLKTRGGSGSGATRLRICFQYCRVLWMGM